MPPHPTEAYHRHARPGPARVRLDSADQLRDRRPLGVRGSIPQEPAAERSVRLPRPGRRFSLCGRRPGASRRCGEPRAAVVAVGSPFGTASATEFTWPCCREAFPGCLQRLLMSGSSAMPRTTWTTARPRLHVELLENRCLPAAGLFPGRDAGGRSFRC